MGYRPINAGAVDESATCIPVLIGTLFEWGSRLRTVWRRPTTNTQGCRSVHEVKTGTSGQSAKKVGSGRPGTTSSFLPWRGELGRHTLGQAGGKPDTQLSGRTWWFCGHPRRPLRSSTAKSSRTRPRRSGTCDRCGGRLTSRRPVMAFMSGNFATRSEPIVSDLRQSDDAEIRVPGAGDVREVWLRYTSDPLCARAQSFWTILKLAYRQKLLRATSDDAPDETQSSSIRVATECERVSVSNRHRVAQGVRTACERTPGRSHATA